MLRRDLQRRFEGVRLGVPARYALQVAVTYSVEPLGYRRDGTITRLRYVATGNWSLATLAVPPRQIASSPIPTRALDSFNVPDLQFFAADSARDAMERGWPSSFRRRSSAAWRWSCAASGSSAAARRGAAG